MRILVTGSRDWTDEYAISTAIHEAWVGAGFPAQVTIVHGACPTGADAIATRVATRAGFAVEKHPANWSAGRAGGPARNKAMVELGADITLAFIGPCTSPRCKVRTAHNSHGATGCAKLAEAAGIPTNRTYPTGGPS